MLIELTRLGVTYPNGTRALAPTSLRFEPGQFCVLLGASGAGKTTLLRSLNGLVTPTEGEISAEGAGNITRDKAALARHRRRTGMIFQHHQLIPRLSALSNVLTGRLGYHPTWRTLFPLPDRDVRIGLRALSRVGLLAQASVRVDQLSGGQKQRVGIARALCQEPALILADEPVASLDPANATAVLSQLRDICRQDGIAAIVSLHQLEYAKRFADRIVGLSDGTVVLDDAPDALTDQDFRRLYGAAPSPVAASAERSIARPVSPSRKLA